MNCQSRLNHVVRIGVVYNIKTPISTAMTAITMSSSISVNALLFLMIVYLLCHIRSGVFYSTADQCIEPSESRMQRFSITKARSLNYPASIGFSHL